MGRIVVTEFLSLDGVMEDPGGAEGYKHGGWAFQFNRGEDGDKFKLDETMESVALLLGRRTYEGFAEAWPSRDGEFADKFNNMPKYVVSSTLKDPDWTNTTVLEGDLADSVGKLRDELDGDHLSADRLESRGIEYFAKVRAGFEGIHRRGGTHGSGQPAQNAPEGW